MDFRYLNAFLEVAENRSFSVAAQNLRIAVSAVSRQVKLFEDSVGLTLLLRSTRNVTLTPEGKGMFEICRQLVREVKVFSGAQEQLVRVGFLQSALEWFIEQGFDEVLKKTELNLSIRVSTPETLENELREGRLDFAFTLKSTSLRDVTSHLIAEEKFVWMTAKNARDTVIIWEPMADASQNPPVPTSRYLRISSLNGAKILAEQGVGVCLLPIWVTKQKKLSRIGDEHHSSKIFLLERDQPFRNERYKKFLDAIKKFKRQL